MFVGGMLGGWLYGHQHISGVFYAGTGLAMLWLIIALPMQKPAHLSTFIVNINDIDDSKKQGLVMKLKQITGVADAALVRQEGIAYLKIDKQVFDQAELQRILNSGE